MSTFSTLNTASMALHAQRRALDVVGQNIANVNTAGYTRQRVDMTAVGGNTVPALHSVSSHVNGGVNADNIVRIRDMFLESRAHTEHANASRLAAEASGLDQVESAFREPGEQGLQALLADMYAGWDDIANNPDDGAARSQMLQLTTAVTEGMHATDKTLNTVWAQTRETLNTTVAEINTATAAIAELNQAIQRASDAGLSTNELADRRDLLVVDLADKIGATTLPGDSGTVNVFVGGTPLVYGNTATAVRAAGPTTMSGITGTDKPRIETANAGYPLTVGGTAAGHLTTLNQTIPAYRDRLDAVAADLAASLNAAHAAGYDQTGAPGGALLGTGGAPGPVTAANITLAITDPAKVAASALAPTPPAMAPNRDGGNADAISQTRLSATGPTARYRQMVTELGVQSQAATRSLAIQQVVTDQVDASRESYAGVNLDEETTNMLNFQHAYAAAGRLVTTIDEMLDVLINRTGTVGR